MYALVIVLVSLLVVEGVILVWYRLKSEQLKKQLTMLEGAARAANAVNEDLRAQLTSVLELVRVRQEKERADEASQAARVSDAVSAADFLRGVVHKVR